MNPNVHNNQLIESYAPPDNLKTTPINVNGIQQRSSLKPILTAVFI